MKLPLFLIASLTALLVGVAGCHAIISHEIDHSFRAVNESLIHSVDGTRDSLVISYEAIQQQSSGVVRRQADSLYWLSQRALHFVDSLQGVLGTLDSLGLDDAAVDRMLVSTPAGKRIHAYGDSLLNRSLSYTTDGAVRTQLQEAGAIFNNSDAVEFTHTYFHGTPPIAAITILSMVKSTAAAMVTLTFNGMLLHSSIPQKDSL